MDACVEKGCKDKSFNTDGFVAHAKQDFISRATVKNVKQGSGIVKFYKFNSGYTGVFLWKKGVTGGYFFSQKR